MELTNGQKQGLDIACKRYKECEPYTVIAGYAGSGKSTLVQFIVKQLNLRERDVVYIAYTGKAVSVLKSKGCENAITAHKLLYHSEELPDGTFEHIPKTKLEKAYKLIVADEASMLPQEMIDLLLSHGVHVLFLGDNAQLPPIDSDQTILDNPHVFLNEITRQALDSPIIRLSMQVRNGKPLQFGGDKFCRVIESDRVSDRLLLGADQILVGKNVTRHKINEQVRQLKWGEQYTEQPLNGEKVICLKNKWNVLGSNSEPLINGQIGQLKNIEIVKLPPYNKVVVADFVSEDGGVYKDLAIDYNLLVHGKPTVNSENWKKYAGAPKLFEFAYGYVITVNKAQGSEFNKVLVYDEAFGDEAQRRKWRYTAITRAQNQLVIAR